MNFYGDFAEDATIRIFFATNDASGGAVAPSSAFEAADIIIYKDGSATQKTATDGITMTSPFDSITGLHLVEIDTSNDTNDAGFWATGSDYTVVLSPDETVDGQTIATALGQFSIENRTIPHIQNAIAVTEHQRGSHTHQPTGKIFYVSPTNGDTHANGNRGGISDPYAGVQDCHDNAVTDSNHDMIILLADAAAGATTLTEDVTLSKRYLFVRGPGRDFIWTRSGSGDTITITAAGVELSGFQLNTAATGSGNGITVTSSGFFAARHLWVNDTQGHAMQLTDCDNFVIEHCSLQGSGQGGSGHGIEIVAGSGETGNYGVIRDNNINDVQGDGIRFDTSGGGTVDAPTVVRNRIQGCTEDGIDVIDTGVTAAFIAYNVFGNNTSDDIEDAGLNTVLLNNEQWSKSSVIGTPAGADLSADIAAVKAETADWADGGRLDLLLDRLITELDTARTEPGQGAPGVSEKVGTKIDYLYKAWRNKVTQTSSEYALYNDDTTTVDHKASVSDDGTTATIDEVATGP